MSMRAAIVLLALGSGACAATAQAPDDAALAPAQRFVQGEVDSGRYLGAVTLVSRAGRIIDWHAYGHRDFARTSPMRADTIFRIYSMTKPVVTAAVLALMDDGKLRLDDSVGKHLAEFSGRPVTIRHLLTHTTGFALASEPLESSENLKAYSEAAARIASPHAPGKRFEYNSVNTEVASRLVEVISGMPLDAFLRARIFVPLGMHDTGFTVPESERGRIAEMTSTDAEGRLISWSAGESRFPGGLMRPYFSGAGGLYSTAGDFARFCHMLIGGGRFEGAAILKPATVGMMTANQLARFDPPVSQYNEGFGLGGFVNLDDPKRERPGSVGAYGWSGAAGTYFMVDRERSIVSMLLTQHLPQGLPRDPGKLSFRFYNLVYQSLAPGSLPK
jgi:CubicO group peptidase (beta-lactamase class C family)